MLQCNVSPHTAQFSWDVDSDTFTITEGDGPLEIGMERVGDAQSKTVRKYRYFLQQIFQGEVSMTPENLFSKMVNCIVWYQCEG